MDFRLFAFSARKVVVDVDAWFNCCGVVVIGTVDFAFDWYLFFPFDFEERLDGFVVSDIRN